MRDATSVHEGSVRVAARSTYVQEPRKRAFIKLETLLLLLPESDVQEPDKEESVKAGKKRARSPTPIDDADVPPTKRMKDENGDGETTAEEVVPVPVWHHTYTFEAHANVSEGDVTTEEARGLGWLAEEDKLKAWLLARSSDHSTRYPLGGTFHINNTLISTRGSELLRLPSLFNGTPLDPEAYALPEQYHHDDLLTASDRLVRFSRASHTLRVSVVVPPHVTSESPLRFTLCVEVTINLLTPQCFQPLLPPQKTWLKRGETAEDIMRPFLVHLLGPDDTAELDGYSGTTDIPFFYSTLRPAPPLDFKPADAAMQPLRMNPTLLPFQRRSVAWLLSREGKRPTENGTIVDAPSEEAELPLGWTRLAPALYANMLTGALSRNTPQHVSCLGGILAEEPGLGKTLESLALILLNPAPNTFSPATTRFDATTQVEVKQVKATLIVTPSALAPQWADEIRTHTPGLKVLIYEGWSKLRVPFTAADVQHLRDEKKSRNEKEKKRAARRAASSSTPAPKARSARGKSAGTARGSAARSTSTAKSAGSVTKSTRSTKASTSSAASGRGKPASGTRASARLKDKGKERVTEPDEEDEEDVDQMDVVEEEDEPEIKKEDDEEGDGLMDWCTYANTFDIVITTYNTLQQDLNIARAPPRRPRRDNAQYSNLERPRSPLVMCEWFRVVMDEVQMVGGGKTEEMVSLIPRRASFAVSGTPARAHVADLVHVLRFLRTRPVPWQRLLRPGYAREFAALFRQYTIRTVKSAVKAELTIPQQTRYLVPIELGNVERHVYDQSFEQALEELGLDARGVAASEAWEVDTGLLRTWLRKLRGIATHPQVGQLLQGKEGEKLGKGVLKTMAEVLEGMCEANWRNTMDERKKKVDGAVRYAQLNQHCEANARRYHLGLEVLLQAEKDAQAIADELQAAIAAHDVKGEELKRQAGALREARAQLLPPPEAGSSLDKGKGKARDGEQTPSSRGSEAPDGEAAVLEGLPKTPAGEAHRSKCQALSARIREARLTLHRVKFLQGDVYHVLGESHAKDEDAAYKSADTIRRDLLKVTEDGALRAMAQLRLTNRKESLTKDELIITVPFFGKGGVRSSDLMDEGDEMIEELLNEQSELLWEWREKLSTLLTEPLTGGDETTGQEYNHTLDTQGEAETYLQAYAHLLADRKEAFSSERTTLAAHEGRDKFVRKTKRAQQAAAADDTVLLESELELQPEHQVLQKELALKRKALREDFDGRALKSIMVDLSSVLARITRDTDPERKIVKDAVANVRRLLVQQEALTTKLEADVAQFRRAFNERILYFRQLQEISDSVVDVEWEGDLNDAIVSALQEERDAETNAKAGKARQRYLDNLAQDQESGDRDEDDAACILCRCDFTRGYITQCAHIFCEGCMKAWLQRKEGKVCPVCRVSVNPADLQRFSVGETEVAQPPPKPIAGSNEVVPRSRRRIEYNFIDKKLLEDINTVESMGSYGSKIQTLVRHLLHVQLQDPGAKSIVFSAWADSLYILQHALTHNGIPCLRIDQSRGKESAAKRFREDPGILVLLLHGERENAGLNVTCASRVFLLESVVNHAFEIQAIARIDRMGQTRPTEVFCYYAEDTVEKNILDLAARQGLSLYTADNAAGTLSVTPFASDVEKKKVEGSPAKKTKERAQKGDFVFSVDDILAIFFPHMYEDLEYLVPMEVEEESGGTGTHGHAPVQENAIAGPSRLHT